MRQDLTIETMAVEDLEMVLGWAAAEGWNPGLGDARAFHAADPQGFFLARVNDLPVAAISVVNHGPDDAFLGLYICQPDWRGQGLGMAIWTHALGHAGRRSVGLDGVPEQEANYAASGFVRVGASLRHQGRLRGATSGTVREAVPEDFEALLALDTSANGFARPAFLESWITGEAGLRETHVLRADDAVMGFATWRACPEGTKVGPIVTPDCAGALTLIAAIAARRPDGPLIIDVPEANAALRSTLIAAGFTVTFATARMYRGRLPQSGANLQAIATMELG